MTLSVLVQEDYTPYVRYRQDPMAWYYIYMRYCRYYRYNHPCPRLPSSLAVQCLTCESYHLARSLRVTIRSLPRRKTSLFGLRTLRFISMIPDDNLCIRAVRSDLLE